MPNDPILKVIADNPSLTAALKELLLKQFELDYNNMPICSHEELGMIVSARLEGRRLVEQAFKEISKYKTIPEAPEKRNEAR